MLRSSYAAALFAPTAATISSNSLGCGQAAATNNVGQYHKTAALMLRPHHRPSAPRNNNIAGSGRTEIQEPGRLQYASLSFKLNVTLH